MTIAEKLSVINHLIRKACEKSGRNPDEITLVAVTKYSSVGRAKEVIENGITHLGENRDQEFLTKYNEIGSKATWHYIGTLQTRKVKNIINEVDYIHSLDRLSLAKEINKRATKPMRCFVQVNISDEESKHGIQPEETISFVKELMDLPNIQVVGLMTMAPHTDDESLLRNCFKELKKLQQEVQGLSFPNAPCNELSMGMSNDFEIAIEEGATIIRIGTALVGKNE